VTSDLFLDGGAVREAGAVILYGAGQIGREVCRVLTKEGIRVICMLDRRASEGDRYLGVPIYTAESCPLDPQRRSSLPVVVTIFNRDVDIPELALALRGMGFTRIVSFVDLHAHFSDALGDRFWLTDRGDVESHENDIAAAEGVLADEESRAQYRAFIALRRSGVFDPRVNPRPQDAHYFPSDIPQWLSSGPVRLVDCGAYEGDTLEQMIAASVQIETSAHFEPDLRNFAGLVRRVRRLRTRLGGPIVLWPCAVSDRSGMVSFCSGLDEASGVSEDGQTNVTAVALDDVLAGWRPTLIKMDIEGSELEALCGARQVIAESLPSLAISVYHRPDHLWRIPLMLASWPELEGYRYYLRSHGFNGFDTVLYACPGESSGSRTSTEVRS
jgi:FkbM family methyltransferase